MPTASTPADYRTTPDNAETGLPKGVPFIIGNEVAERFSFYGMKAILVVFMTKHMLDAQGEADYMSDEQAKVWYHSFTAAAYFFPILGAILSDVLWGKYKTILLISLLYCVGHGMLALMDLGPVTGLWDMQPFLLAGLALIAIGSGGIKPCVSAHVGDQFGRGNKGLMTQVFNWFYFSINLGAVTSTLLTPWLLEHYGPAWAFGVPGVLMAVATFVFWLGRHRFIHVPPAGWRAFKQETFSPEGLRAMRNLAPIFLIFVPVFWSIFDQTGSAWVLQAKEMDRQFAGQIWLESQVQALNPLLILVLIPVFTYVVYPLAGKVVKVTPLRKIGFGLGLTAVAFGISAFIETQIQMRASEAAQGLWTALTQAGVQPPAGEGAASLDAALRAAAAEDWSREQIQPFLDNMPNIGWQFIAYVVLTSAEILVSIVALEFAYTQAPRKMKSFIMGIFFLGVSLGNVFTAGVNSIIAIPQQVDPETGVVIREAGSMLEGASYYWFFTALAGVTTLAFIVYSQFYKGETYIQGEGEDAESPTDPDAPEPAAIRRAEAEAEGTDPR
jgi:POT family proton-dependent oligopeptide transporter